MKAMKEVAKEMIDLLVDHPEDVRVEEKSEGRTITLIIDAHKDDVGKIIGKQGNNIKSLRTLLKAISAKCYQKSLIMGVAEDYIQ
jgi:predicted RNA-binding protein YlqC (UPF0109 family)